MIESITADKLLKKDIPKIEYLVEGIIPKAGLVYCFGPSGSFKTNFLLYLVMMGAIGKNVFDFNIKEKFRTLWLDEENRDIGMKDKISKISNGIGIENGDLRKINILISEGFNILNKIALDNLDYYINKHNPDLVVIDSIAKVFPLSERNEGDVRKIYTFLKPFITKYKLTFIIIHHARKKNFMQFTRDIEDISGSREFAAMADSILLLDEMTNGKYMLKQVKNRYFQKVYAENFEVTGDDNEMRIIYTGKAKDKYLAKALEVKYAIRKWIKDKNIKLFKRKDAVEIMKTEGL
ncbi:MAG: AAA family ATPase, partial [Candidatus Aenigmarchaeota archaeon]|nr:AAA family ATPase [Candidatus Aenigmarchaeota archaeon]